MGCKVIHTRSSLSQRYGVTTTAMKLWYSPAGVIPPRKKGGYFNHKEVEMLDYFYLATRFCKLTFREYESKVLPMGGLAKYVLYAIEVTLKDFLLNPEYVDQEDVVVKDILRRLENDASYQSSGFRVESAA
ncbi:hypothetical protein NIES2101_36915 [Calothrix sp. HK-06]|nr:hypothetical protein NIES2101_36915 [Calothrix sp. HK-06]